MRILELLEEIERDAPRFLYHASPEFNEKQILANGLSRKSKSSDFDDGYDNRIYFFDYFNKGDITKYMSQLFPDVINRYVNANREFFKQTNRILIPFIVFKIDTTKLSGFKFHHDEHSHGYQEGTGPVWTDSGDIPPDALSVVWRSKFTHVGNKKYDVKVSNSDREIGPISPTAYKNAVFQVVDPGLTPFIAGDRISQSDYDKNKDYGLTVKKI